MLWFGYDIGIGRKVGMDTSVVTVQVNYLAYGVGVVLAADRQSTSSSGYRASL
jgi:hypothetical protein